jgi:hypothetical protein
MAHGRSFVKLLARAVSGHRITQVAHVDDTRCNIGFSPLFIIILRVISSRAEG